MPPSAFRRLRLLFVLLSLLFLAAASVGLSPSCPFSPAVDLDDHHHHHHHHDHDHDHHCGHHHHHDRHGEIRGSKLPEELAEEEDLMMLDGLDHHHHHEHHHHHSHGDQHNELSPAGERRLGACDGVLAAGEHGVTDLPHYFAGDLLFDLLAVQGKPSKAVVDSLAVFGVILFIHFFRSWGNARGCFSSSVTPCIWYDTLSTLDNISICFFQGFTAGGFIYIAVAGVLPEMHDGKTTFRGTIVQLTSLILGMAVALCISIVE
ncbi:hypothetical protein GW17_00006752 [Ensete ventricosum]|nr:hypothetical protein GW17_00006752 [Ensete ventricosum]